MDLSKFTIADIVSVITAISGNQNKMSEKNKDDQFIGSYVLVRCSAAGLVYGKLVSYEGRSAHLTEARILWRWRCAEGITSFDIANHGLKLDGYSRVSEKSDAILTEDCAIIKCSQKCINTLEQTPAYKG